MSCDGSGVEGTRAACCMMPDPSRPDECCNQPVPEEIPCAGCEACAPELASIVIAKGLVAGPMSMSLEKIGRAGHLVPAVEAPDPPFQAFRVWLCAADPFLRITSGFCSDDLYLAYLVGKAMAAAGAVGEAQPATPAAAPDAEFPF